jgi:hypothetical protein
MEPRAHTAALFPVCPFAGALHMLSTAEHPSANSTVYRLVGIQWRPGCTAVC